MIVLLMTPKQAAITGAALAHQLDHLTKSDEDDEYKVLTQQAIDSVGRALIGQQQVIDELRANTKPKGK